MRKLIHNYSLFLALVSDRFSGASTKHGARCRRGCHRCCSSGLFTVSPLDALYLRENLKRVPASVRRRVIAQAGATLDLLEQRGFNFRKDPLLRSSRAADRLGRESSGIRCPALNEKNQCLIYDHRPLLCRLFGPTVRGQRRTVLLEGCGRFSKELPEADFPILSIYKDEDVFLRAYFASTGVSRIRNVSTIIPAALALADVRRP
jgi:Fe-S-cluster containining protein